MGTAVKLSTGSKGAKAMKSKNEHDALEKHLGEVEDRAKGRAHAVKRGPQSRPSPAASGSWRAEGRTQCAGQMDVWECIQEVQKDS